MKKHVWMRIACGSLLLCISAGAGGLAVSNVKSLEQIAWIQRAMSAPAASKTWEEEFLAGKVILDKISSINFVDMEKEKEHPENNPLLDERLLAQNARTAEAHLRIALERAQAADADQTAMSDILFYLARSLAFQSKNQEAKKLMLSSLEIRKKVFGAQSLPATYCLHCLAILVQSEGDHKEAEDLMIDVYENYLALLPRTDSRFAQVLPVLGGYTRDPAEAAEYYGHYAEVEEKIFGKNSPKIVLALELYAAALSNNRQHAQAARVYEHAAAIRKAFPAETIPGNAEEHMLSERRIAAGEMPDLSENQDRQTGRRTIRKQHGIKFAELPAENRWATIKEKYGLFDNRSMFEALQKAELLAKSDYPAAKKQWTRVLEFMEEPGWVPTAALVPISLECCRLASICMDRDNFADADELLRGAFYFPFFSQQDRAEIDSVSSRLVNHYIKTNKIDQLNNFLNYVMPKLARSQGLEPTACPVFPATYKKWQKLMPAEKD